MKRSQRQLLIEAFRLLRIRAKDGEKLAKGLATQDLGPTSFDRHEAIDMLKKHTASIVEQSQLLLKSIEEHQAAQVVLDRVHFPRAKPLSSSKP